MSANYGTYTPEQMAIAAATNPSMCTMTSSQISAVMAGHNPASFTTPPPPISDSKNDFKFTEIPTGIQTAAQANIAASHMLSSVIGTQLASSVSKTPFVQQITHQNGNVLGNKPLFFTTTADFKR